MKTERAPWHPLVILKALGIVVTGLLVCVSLLVALTSADDRARDKTNQAQAIEEILSNLETHGLITKRTCIGNETQVNRLVWESLNADARKNTTIALAQWCEGQGDVARMTVIDNQNGARLARYDFESYESFAR